MRKSGHRTILFFLFGIAPLLSNPVIAETAYPSLEYAGGEVNYSGKTVAVGGRTIVGIGVARADANTNFSTWMPAAHGLREFCVNITNQSGNFQAALNFRRPESDTTGGRRGLPFLEKNPKYAELMSKLNADQIGMLVEMSACDDVVAGPYLLGGWKSEIDARPPRRISIMINSRSSDHVALELVAEDLDAAPKYGKCRALPSGRRQGFDRICEVELHDAVKQRIVVTTIGFGGDRNPPVVAEIIVPP